METFDVKLNLQIFLLQKCLIQFIFMKVFARAIVLVKRDGTMSLSLNLPNRILTDCLI